MEWFFRFIALITFVFYNKRRRLKSITLHTTQNVAIEYELSSIGERVMAFVLDVMIFGFSYYAFIYIIVIFLQPLLFESRWTVSILLSFLPLFGFLMYHFLLETFNNGRSLGKQLVGIKVVRLTERETEVFDFLIRALLLLVDFFSSLGGLAILLMASTENRQRMGDLAANTVVIRNKKSAAFSWKDIEKITKSETDLITFPEAKRLSEADMLTVKSLLERQKKHKNVMHYNLLHETARRIAILIEVEEPPKHQSATFLTSVLRDYILLTR